MSCNNGLENFINKILEVFELCYLVDAHTEVIYYVIFIRRPIMNLYNMNICISITGTKVKDGGTIC